MIIHVLGDLKITDARRQKSCLPGLVRDQVKQLPPPRNRVRALFELLKSCLEPLMKLRLRAGLEPLKVRFRADLYLL